MSLRFCLVQLSRFEEWVLELVYNLVKMTRCQLNNRNNFFSMHMSSLNEHSKEKQNSSSFSFTDRLKTIVHEQLKTRTIIFTMTNENSKFHYYTILDPEKSPYIELYWVIDFLPKHFSLTVTYSTYRTLGIPIVVNDLRTKVQVNFSLKLINKNVPCFLKYLMNEKNQICINFERSIFHSTDRHFLLKSLKSIVNQTFQSTRQQFQTLHTYLTIPLQMMGRSNMVERDMNQSEEFNLIKLKNTFDRFRKNRQKTAELIYEQKDILKLRKKIQQCTKLLGLDLRTFQNLKYTTKEIQRSKLLTLIDGKLQIMQSSKTDKRIAHQFQIIKIEGLEKKFEVNANSEIYFGKYSYRIFRTIVEDDRMQKSTNSQNVGLQSDEKDIIEERVSCLVKKKATNKLSEKALKNETSFLKLMRNQVCLYIANYFLPLENAWGELYLEKYDSSLLGFLNQGKILSFSTRLDIMIKVLLGLKFISDSSICHRDIKPSNIMISKQNIPKIIDFGSTISAYNQRVIMSCNQTLCGTEGYYFPYEKCDEKIKQMFSRNQYETHVLFDVYSYATVVEIVFEEELRGKLSNETIKDTLTFIVERCKQQNPDNRLSYEQILCLLMVLQRTLQSGQKKEKILQL